MGIVNKLRRDKSSNGISYKDWLECAELQYGKDFVEDCRSVVKIAIILV